MADRNVEQLVNPLRFGNVIGGNYLEIELDGTEVSKGDASTYDDLSFPAIAQNLDVSSGRIDYDYTEQTIDFRDNARYPNEVLSITYQMRHTRKNDSNLFPHIHWFQNQNAFPNLLCEYRWYNNGDLVPSSFTQVILSSADNIFPYTSGVLFQITQIAAINGVGKGLSSNIDIKLYRDSNNNSGLFTGPDSYSGDFKLKQLDLHFEQDMKGSRQPYVK